jgi:hypothetical protein
VHEYTCADCGRELDEQTRPCPNCGGSRRNVAVNVNSVMAVASVEPVGIEVTYGSQRPWYERWLDVQRRLKELEGFYQPESRHGNDIMKGRFEEFFVTCLHMVDWLHQDTTTGLTDTQVWTFVDGDPDLRICEGMASTWKHHTRNTRRPAITARIGKVRTNPGGGGRVWIDWSDGNSSGTVDALDLARRCEAAWPKYLAANGLTPPS